MLAQRAHEYLATLAAQGVQPSGVSHDSRAVRPGDLFLAYPGARSDGRRYIADALAKGAVAVLWEKSGFIWDHTLHCPHHFPVEQLAALAGHIAHAVYGRPSEQLWLAGVTGTNGKTSVTQWLAYALARLGHPCAVIGTLGNGLPGHLAASANTTPDAVSLHQLLSGFQRQELNHVAMEVSSIGLHQGRTNGALISAAAFTNLSRDHLDYHGSLDAYAATKSLLFDHPGLKHAVLNLDDAFGQDLAHKLAGSRVRRIGYSLEGQSGADEVIRAVDIRATSTGQAFKLTWAGHSYPLEVPLLGRFNIANLLCVAGLLHAAGIHMTHIVQVLPQLVPPAGRMQRLGGEGEPLVVVDYAHTPDALQQALQALRPSAEARQGRLLCVFGCGGDRDRGKRPMMGEIAARLADQLIITDDNPRSENPAHIRKAIHDAAPAALVIADRGAAIRHSIVQAQAKDVVLLAGKGHETYQEVAGHRSHFSDFEEAANALAAREDSSQ